MIFLKQEKLIEKIIKYFLLFFVFVIMLGAAFVGMQWFSNSVGGFFSGQVAGLSNNFDVASASAAGAYHGNSQGLIIAPGNNSAAAKEGDVSAQSALAIEFGDGNKDKILFEKNANKPLPIASLTKLMTVLVVLENYNLDYPVTISHEAMRQEGEQGNLKEGQVLSIKNLLYITLIESSNRAAYALSEVIGTGNFVALMNKRARDLGLADTHFEGPTGLDASSYSTVFDLATLSEYLFMHYPLFGQITSLKEFNVYLPDGTLHHTLESTNQLLGTVSNIVAGKTGYTNEAGGCFMLIRQNPTHQDYRIYIVLGSQDRFGEVAKIINWTGQ